MELKGIYTADEHRYDKSAQMYQRCGCSGVLLPKVSLGFWHNFGSVDPYERSREITPWRDLSVCPQKPVNMYVTPSS